MTKRTIALVLATAAAGLTAATPMLAQAHDYRRYDDDCTDRIHRNGTTGAIIGGLAGAAIGSNLAASHGGRTGGAVLGAAAGAAVGSNIARSSTKDSCRPRYRTAYRYEGYAPAYYAPPPPPPRPVYVVREPAPVYVVQEPVYYERRHDNGLHRGWYKHHHDEDDD